MQFPDVNKKAVKNSGQPPSSGAGWEQYSARLLTNDLSWPLSTVEGVHVCAPHYVSCKGKVHELKPVVYTDVTNPA